MTHVHAEVVKNTRNAVERINKRMTSGLFRHFETDSISLTIEESRVLIVNCEL